MSWITAQRQREINTVIKNVELNTGFSYPQKNIVSLAQELGMSVFEVEFAKNPGVNAMLVYSDDKNDNRPTIYIKKSLPDTRKRFTLAHEIGHYLLHKKGNVKFRLDGVDYSTDSEYVQEESEANYFAASILVPEDELNKLRKFFDTDLDLISSYFGVSTEVIENRIKWLKMNRTI